jgi:hypothetical protein
MITVAAVMHVYEVRPREDRRRIDLISETLPFGGLWYAEPLGVLIPLAPDVPPQKTAVGGLKSGRPTTIRNFVVMSYTCRISLRNSAAGEETAKLRIARNKLATNIFYCFCCTS